MRLISFLFFLKTVSLTVELNYSFSYSNHQIREIQRQYYSTLDEILEKILSLFDATIISNIHNKLPILKEAFNVYLFYSFHLIDLSVSYSVCNQSLF